MFRVWERMAAKFQARWTTNMGKTPFDLESGRLTAFGAEWMHGLRGLTRAQIWAGMDRLDLIGKGYPPTLPEFRAICWSHPSIDEVEGYLNGTAPLTPFALVIARKLDLWKWRKSKQDVARDMLKKAYDALCLELQEGRKLPDLDPQLAKPVKENPRYAPPHVVRSHIEQISRQLGIENPATSKIDAA